MLKTITIMVTVQFGVAGLFCLAYLVTNRIGEWHLGRKKRALREALGDTAYADPRVFETWSDAGDRWVDMAPRKYRITFTNMHGDLLEAECYVSGRWGVFIGIPQVIRRGADAEPNPVLDPLREENFRLRQELAELKSRWGA